MSYYFTKEVDTNFEDSITHIKEKLKEKGFGVLTEIDLKATLKKKIDVDLYNYKILGACSPSHAYQAILAEDKIGLMLPCNVIVQQKSDSAKVEISAVDPVASMGAVENDSLGGVATEVRRLLSEVIEEL